MQAHRRHDISDRVWKKLEPHLPGSKGRWRGKEAWEKLLDILVEEHDYEQIIINGTHGKVHPMPMEHLGGIRADALLADRADDRYVHHIRH